MEFAIGLNAVILAVTDEVPRILTVRRPDHGLAPQGSPLAALPFGPLDLEGDRTLEAGLRRWVREQTGIELGYAEQLYTFGDRDRDPHAGARVVSVAYLALVREQALAGTGEARWDDCYAFFPWEDWREGRPRVLDEHIAPGLERWIRAAVGDEERRVRRERTAITFGLSGSPWDATRVLERYELLYAAGLVPESGATEPLGEPMALDHRRITATALSRVRGKLEYRPVVFELVPDTFTLSHLQRVVEALAGVRLHKQNFRRLLEGSGLVEGTDEVETRTGGRPAELFRFRREVLRERPAPGVRLPAARHTP